MKKAFLPAPAPLPGPVRKRGNPAAVLANFNDSRGGKLLDGGLQFGGEFHNHNINKIGRYRTIFLDFDAPSVTSGLQRPATSRWTSGSGRWAARMRSWTTVISEGTRQNSMTSGSRSAMA